MTSIGNQKFLRVSEVYLSIQGEGPRVGEPTVFVRFAGCNLRCPGWPCDTPHAIDPKIYTKDAKLQTPEEVLARVQAAAPNGANICYTGGEPFLQRPDSLEALLELLSGDGYVTQEVFTNGTLRFPVWAYDELYFIMDWKLSGSGEESNIFGAEGVQNVRNANVQDMNAGDAIKFTIASEKDYAEAKYFAAELKKINNLVDFYYGVVWGKLEASQLIEWALADGLSWTYTHQVHNVIWDRTKRGI